MSLRTLLLFVVVVMIRNLNCDCLSLDQFNKTYLTGLPIDKLQDYIRIDPLLGVGGTSVVYKIEIQIPVGKTGFTKVEVAAKIINNSFVSDESFFQEIQFMEKITDKIGKCVPQFIDCIHEPFDTWVPDFKDGQCQTKFTKATSLRVIIMEKSYGDLTLTAENNPTLKLLAFAPKSVKLNFYAKIAFCISELHKHGLVHGDIKGNNILLMDQSFSDIRIIDFSDVKQIGYPIQSGTTKYADADYMLAKNGMLVSADWHTKDKASVERDLYAFGMLIFHTEEYSSKLAQDVENSFYHQKDTCHANILKILGQNWTKHKNLNFCAIFKTPQNEQKIVSFEEILQNLLALNLSDRICSTELVSSAFLVFAEVAQKRESLVSRILI